MEDKLKPPTLRTLCMQIKWLLCGLTVLVVVEIFVMSFVMLRNYGTSVAHTKRLATKPIYGITHLIELPAGQPFIITESIKPSHIYENISSEMFLQHYHFICNNNFISTPVHAGMEYDDVNSTKPQGPLNTSNSTSGSEVKNVSNGKVLPFCPCVPKLLKGAFEVSLDAPPRGQNLSWQIALSKGGMWEPQDCLARHHTAIIIPFRDREQHLQILLHYLHPMLQRQLIRYRIFVIEQSAPEMFNKAAMMNVGFAEASKMANFDCYIFHDVDMIPEDDRNFYTCMPFPRHVASHCKKFNYTIPYPGLFGGATAFTKDQFTRVNGFTNKFYGWGGEDDDMTQRIKGADMNIVRFPRSVARYKMIPHGRDRRNPTNPNGYLARNYRPFDYSLDGLSTLKYNITRQDMLGLYTWMFVKIPPEKYKIITINRGTTEFLINRV